MIFGFSFMPALQYRTITSPQVNRMTVSLQREVGVIIILLPWCYVAEIKEKVSTYYDTGNN